MEGWALRFRIRNLVLAAAVYLVVAVVLAQESFGPLGAALVYSGICMLLTWYMIANAETRRTGETIEFNQLNPASSLGVQYESFHHVFNSQEPVIEALLKNISTALVSKLGCSPLRQITLKDVDKELPKPESRVFYLSTAPLTVRKSEITLLWLKGSGRSRAEVVGDGAGSTRSKCRILEVRALPNLSTVDYHAISERNT
jgi:hypothetical protein